ncbi:MAG: DUF3038 domain-containing protein [Pseudanabaenaceae cyanobacterium bins.68]|nr:DUF3038 domain-containing protein [Pseudanabaenaceae cyanobacterium bins.68]
MSKQVYPPKAHLDLVLIALEAFTGAGSDQILAVAQSLGLAEVLGDRVTLWRLRQASPLRKGKGGRKKLDLDEARALVLISCRLAQQHHGQIRQAIAYLEDPKTLPAALYHHPLLAEYLERFQTYYRDRLQTESGQNWQNLALKLLIDLLFYGAPTGAKRLWLVLLEDPP